MKVQSLGEAQERVGFVNHRCWLSYIDFVRGAYTFVGDKERIMKSRTREGGGFRKGFNTQGYVTKGEDPPEVGEGAERVESVHCQRRIGLSE